MKSLGTKKIAGGSVGSLSRKPIGGSQSDLVTLSYIDPDRRLPLVIEPSFDGVDLIAWAGANRTYIEDLLHTHGGILFRNFQVQDVTAFEQFISAAYSEALAYRERSSPRSEIGNKVYTSTDYPADQSIFLHNEHSYSATFPLRILFYCDIPPEQGGETPIADCRKVLSQIDPKIRERFIQRGWMYVRNFGDGFGLPWQQVFQSSDRAVVEDYCKRAGIEVEWKSGDRLRTRQVRPAVAKHPHTGELIWFNHLTFFHVSTLPPTIRDTFLAQFAEEDLPNNTYYGDGAPIEADVMEQLRAAYMTEKVVFPWKHRDILLLDNMLTAHAREPFVGARKIVVGMAEAYTRTDI